MFVFEIILIPRRIYHRFNENLLRNLKTCLSRKNRISRINLILPNFPANWFFLFSPQVARTHEKTGTKIQFTLIIFILSLKFPRWFPRRKTRFNLFLSYIPLYLNFLLVMSQRAKTQFLQSFNTRTSTQFFNFNDGLSESFLSITSRVNPVGISQQIFAFETQWVINLLALRTSTGWEKTLSNKICDWNTAFEAKRKQKE